MGFADVRAVASLLEAQQLCEAGRADACLVVLPSAVPDELAPVSVEMTAPSCGTPACSLLLADVVTPYLRRAARRAGYGGVVATGMAPRLLYRRIGGMLQQSRRAARAAKAPTLRIERSLRMPWAGRGSVDPGRLKLQ
jgi:hypothetical protein